MESILRLKNLLKMPIRVYTISICVEKKCLNLFSLKFVQDIEGLRGDGEASVVEIKLVERRMNVVLTDYEGTGANNNHDPIPPGRF